jgi:hypothetical protein
MILDMRFGNPTSNSNNDMEDHVTCIVGMHRSGTSMVAGLLQRCGLYLGPDNQLLGANSGNPEGHYEHGEFFRIDEALLHRLGGSWDFPPSLKPGWEHDDSLAGLRQDAKTLVDTFYGKLPWGWKEPRTTILLPFWKSIIPQLRFVICVRSPLEVAQSLAKRNKIPIDQGVTLWHRYMRAAIQDTESCQRFFAYYEDFIADPEVQVQTLIDFCGLARPSDFSEDTAGIRRELWHQRCGLSEILTADSIPAEPKLLYLGLRALSGRRRVSKTLNDLRATEVGEFLRLIDQLHDHQQVVRLQAELTEKNHELFKVRTEMLNELKTNHRWAYRFYRNFIRPFRARLP